MKKKSPYKDVIEDFRKNYKKAIKAGWRKSKIIEESELSWGTLKTLLEQDPETTVIRASVKAKIQLFCKKVAQEVFLTDKGFNPLTEEEIKAEMDKLKSDTEISNEKKNDHLFKEKEPLEGEYLKTPETPDSLKGKRVGDPITDEERDFFVKLGEAYKSKPQNCVIHINLY